MIRLVARPRAYDPEPVIEAAKELFWSHGYEFSGLTDLERATGLSRSSLYLAFGPKQVLFETALAHYVATFVDPLLTPLEGPGAGLPEVAGFFRALGRFFRKPEAQRGCLMFNTIGELGGRYPWATDVGAAFVRRYRAAVANALRGAARAGEMDARAVKRRTDLLSATNTGLWMHVRLDPPAASAACRGVAREIMSWKEERRGMRAPRT